MIVFFPGENASTAHLSVSINLVLASFTLRFSKLFVQFMVLRWLAIFCALSSLFVYTLHIWVSIDESGAFQSD